METLDLVTVLMATPYAPQVLAVCGIARAFTILAPTSLTAKIPNKVMKVINILALSSNKSVDNAGNPLISAASTLFKSKIK